ncbi:MAG TPA: hypothetical protein VEF34_10520 [Syntrophobacteraceae bacterium]|nr:hypothetical protein [Syntrophobacteraceae bacterium]
MEAVLHELFAHAFSGQQAVESTLIDLRPYLDSAIPHDPVVKKLDDIKQVLEKTKGADEN